MKYDEVKKSLESVPMTWIPALLVVLVEQAVKKNVFIPDQIGNFVARVEIDARTSNTAAMESEKKEAE